MTRENQKVLLQLARAAIGNTLNRPPQDLQKFIKKEFKEKRGIFVTLHLDGNLKGCIGHLDAADSIYNNVVYLSRAAAFHDVRFSPLTEDEFNRVKIEISILSIPKKLKEDNTENMVNSLRPGVDGVILKIGSRSATFLPQVWDQLPDRKSFMDHLCIKVGVAGYDWLNTPIELSIYQVECFNEKA